ncbi:MAG TPA: AAA family ATPase [Candidatus Nanoarchaeia archaeon]|nr:AAA family ATPase [Candidatus Nanoarchaeia archaeon]
MADPYCLIISGPSGSGKTTTAKMLWKSLDGNPAYLSLDSIKHLVSSAESTDYFLDLARLNALSLTENFLCRNHPIIIEKAFGNYKYVRDFIELADNLQVKSHYFKLNAPLEILIERADRRRNASLREKVESGEWPLPIGNRETVTSIYNFFMKYQHNEGIEIDTSNKTPEEVTQLIRSYLI